MPAINLGLQMCVLMCCNCCSCCECRVCGAAILHPAQAHLTHPCCICRSLSSCAWASMHRQGRRLLVLAYTMQHAQHHTTAAAALCTATMHVSYHTLDQLLYISVQPSTAATVLHGCWCVSYKPPSFPASCVPHTLHLLLTALLANVACPAGRSPCNCCVSCKLRSLQLLHCLQAALPATAALPASRSSSKKPHFLQAALPHLGQP
jgi:hypothetical protein